jgi:hypothetical protein
LWGKRIFKTNTYPLLGELADGLELADQLGRGQAVLDTLNLLDGATLATAAALRAGVHPDGTEAALANALITPPFLLDASRAKATAQIADPLVVDGMVGMHLDVELGVNDNVGQLQS